MFKGKGRIKRILRLCRFEFFEKGEGRHKRIQAVSPSFFWKREKRDTKRIQAVSPWRILFGRGIWEGAPQGLVDGMAEYVAEMAGFRRGMVSGGGEMPQCREGGGGWWWEDKDPSHVARLLHYCEKFKKGFIQRLNEAMRDTWHDRVVDEVLGMPVMELCGRLYNDNNASWVGSISM